MAALSDHAVGLLHKHLDHYYYLVYWHYTRALRETEGRLFIIYLSCEFSDFISSENCFNRILLMLLNCSKLNSKLISTSENLMASIATVCFGTKSLDDKRCRVESSLDMEMMTTCDWLLKSCSRLQGLRSWASARSKLETIFIFIPWNTCLWPRWGPV